MRAFHRFWWKRKIIFFPIFCRCRPPAPSRTRQHTQAHQRRETIAFGRRSNAVLERGFLFIVWRNRGMAREIRKRAVVEAELDRVESLAAHGADVTRRTGLLLSPHYAAPKLARLLEEIPGGHQRAAVGELIAGTLDAFLVRQLA